MMSMVDVFRGKELGERDESIEGVASGLSESVLADKSDNSNDEDEEEVDNDGEENDDEEEEDEDEEDESDNDNDNGEENESEGEGEEEEEVEEEGNKDDEAYRGRYSQVKEFNKQLMLENTSYMFQMKHMEKMSEKLLHECRVLLGRLMEHVDLTKEENWPMLDDLGGMVIKPQFGYPAETVVKRKEATKKSVATKKKSKIEGVKKLKASPKTTGKTTASTRKTHPPVIKMTSNGEVVFPIILSNGSITWLGNVDYEHSSFYDSEAKIYYPIGYSATLKLRDLGGRRKTIVFKITSENNSPMFYVSGVGWEFQESSTDLTLLYANLIKTMGRVPHQKSLRRKHVTLGYGIPQIVDYFETIKGGKATVGTTEVEIEHTQNDAEEPARKKAKGKIPKKHSNNSKSNDTNSISLVTVGDDSDDNGVFVEKAGTKKQPKRKQKKETIQEEQTTNATKVTTTSPKIEGKKRRSKSESAMHPITGSPQIIAQQQHQQPPYYAYASPYQQMVPPEQGYVQGQPQNIPPRVSYYTHYPQMQSPTSPSNPTTHTTFEKHQHQQSPSSSQPHMQMCYQPPHMYYYLPPSFSDQRPQGFHQSPPTPRQGMYRYGLPPPHGVVSPPGNGDTAPHPHAGYVYYPPPSHPQSGYVQYEGMQSIPYAQPHQKDGVQRVSKQKKEENGEENEEEKDEKE
eukprot:m.34699 g.34699  ORF g.34699 m.34699 type:complete len:683 (+) comp9942_c1_seq3:92-2140(+)